VVPQRTAAAETISSVYKPAPFTPPPHAKLPKGPDKAPFLERIAMALVGIAAMIAGEVVVHNAFKPDMVREQGESEEEMLAEKRLLRGSRC